MKVLIDIPEDIYKFVCQLSCEDSYHYDDVVLTSVKNGTPIPDNATNGDVIKAMFPSEEIYRHTFGYDLGDDCSFNENWWKAPYQKGGKE